MDAKDTQEKQIHFRISKKEKDDFKKHCAKEGYAFSARIKALMKNDVQKQG